MNTIVQISAALFLTGACLLLSGCGAGGLTKQDALRQYAALAHLSDGVEDARGRQGELLAPQHFEATDEHLNDGLTQARKAKKDEAIQAAERGLIALTKLNGAIEANRQVMEEVLDMRARTISQGAGDLFAKRLADADESFQEASELLEDGKQAKARDKRSALIDEYAQLELEALKKGKVETSRIAIGAAENAGASKYAPKTLGLAKDELKLVVSVLEADRTQTEKANSHAERATWLAHRAREVTQVADYFEKQNLTGEDRILWYQGQLQQVRRALSDETLPFDKPNAQVILALQQDTKAMQSVLANMRETNTLTREQIAGLEQELDTQRRSHQTEMKQLLAQRQDEAQEAEKRAAQQLQAVQSGSKSQLASMEKEMMQAREEAAQRVEQLKQRLSAEAQAKAEAERQRKWAETRFTSVQGLFSEAEAEVFRQGDDIVIRLKGFAFPSGRSDISANNYGLLNKVVGALNTFTNAKATVTGHTDNRGGERRNLELSAARAQSVVKFLTAVGGVTEGRLTADGKGEELPVGNNDTTEGRAQNRRIDVRIFVNDAAGEVAGI
jgi:outer membrane protein OmpA-like peptidoglycan-associated protein